MATVPVQIRVTKEEFRRIQEESERTGKPRASLIASLFRRGLAIQDLGTVVIQSDDGTLREVVIYTDE